MEIPELLLCDLDGTLAVKWKKELLPGVQSELARVDRPVAIVTNQGGVHARYAWEQRGNEERAAPYPTLETIQERITEISRRVPQVERAYAALFVGHYGYEMPEPAPDVVVELPTGILFHASWRPAWRKPETGMLQQACHDFGVLPADALMLGDSEDDQGAAERMNIPFIRVSDEWWQPGVLGEPGPA